ncbi:MAG TPA: hypothetical protein VLE70_22535 [Anaerolineae bacterium]|jgi:hypothetical protein|nr:hypothetical protein [Anaerolineae bacterium]
MSTIVLIIVGLVAGLALLVGIGYLLERYGVIAKIKEIVANIEERVPTLKRWLITGGIALALLIGLVVILIIIF